MHTQPEKNKIIQRLQDIFGTALVVLVIYYAVTLDIERGKYSVLFLGLSYALILFKGMQRARFMGLRGTPLIIVGFMLIVIFLVATAYLYLEYIPLLADRAGAYNSVDVLVGAAIFIPLFLIIWPEGGASMFLLICGFTLYFLYGNHIPGIFGHSGFSVIRTFEEAILGFDGVYGVVLLTISTWVAIFLVYAGIIQGFGTLEVIVKGCTLIFSRRKIFIPQIPIMSSMIFGSFSGSATANVAGTGSFTIRIMQRFGLTPTTAGAIEAVASSGGQIMPPLMGATAFLIASFLGVSYLHVAAVGFIPALLFYLVFAYSVYLRTSETIDATTVDILETTAFTVKDWLELMPLILSVGILFTRLILMVPMMTACMESIAVYLIAQFLLEVFRDRHTKSYAAIFRDFSGRLFDGICKTAPSVASIAIVGACMGLIVRVLTVTGLGPKLSSIIVDVSGGSLPLLVLLTMVLSILFGMAVSTIAVYILTTFVVAPAFSSVGIPQISTHFMIMYLGCMSFITPPVAPAALVAAGISGAGFMPTAWSAVFLGAPLFLLAATFVYEPALLVWSWQTPVAIVFSMIGLIGMATVFHMPMGKINYKTFLERIVATVVACGTMFVVDRKFGIPFAVLTAVWVYVKLRKIRSCSNSTETEVPPTAENF